MSKAENKRKTARLKRKADAAREALIGKAIDALRRQGAMAIGDVGACIGEPNARRLSAALRVARRGGRVTYDGRVYGVPVEAAKVEAPAVPAWVREGQRVRGRGGIIHGCTGTIRQMGRPGQWCAVGADGRGIGRAGDASVIAEQFEPVIEPTPSHGVARDLAEREAFGPGGLRTLRAAHIGRILTAAGAREATADAPGLLVSHTDDGRVVLRWGIRRDVGGVVACSLTDSADAMMERAAWELAKAGFKATVGDDGGNAGFRTSASTLQSVGVPDGDQRAGVPTEAERIAALEARAAAYAATIVELSMRLIASEKARAA